jgi:hypothetical protein
MSGLRQDMRNCVLQLLLTQLKHVNGSRWATMNADFGNKPITYFISGTIHKSLLHIDSPSTYKNRLVDSDQSLDTSSLTRYPAILPIKDTLPA